MIASLNRARDGGAECNCVIKGHHIEINAAVLRQRRIEVRDDGIV